MKIALITGSRSDRNALVMVEKALKEAGHNLKWIASSAPHEMKRPRDTAIDFGIAACNGNLMAVFEEWFPDMVIIHGDRYETLATVCCANIMGVPIAHVGGGDLTEGSQDDCFRHAITKLSHLHFASNQDSADRIVQMGEEPERVHVTGCPGIDMVMATPTYGRDETFAAVGLDLVRMAAVQGHNRTILVLFHPNTLGDTRAELKSLSDALMSRTEELVLLGPNADAGSDLIRREWQRLAQNRSDTVYHDNVDPKVFYSLLKWCDVLVGNSSAGFYEAPCFRIPVISLGDRQQGRSHSANSFQMSGNSSASAIADQINMVLGIGRPVIVIPGNLYGDGHAAERIAKVISGIEDPRALLRKKFRTCPKLSGGYCSLDEKLEPLAAKKPRVAFTTAMKSFDDHRYGYHGEGLT